MFELTRKQAIWLSIPVYVISIINLFMILFWDIDLSFPSFNTISLIIALCLAIIIITSGIRNTNKTKDATKVEKKQEIN